MASPDGVVMMNGTKSVLDRDTGMPFQLRVRVVG